MNAGAYALASYSADGRTPRAGIVVDEEMLDAAVLLGRDTGPVTVLEVLQDWAVNHVKLRRAAQARRAGGSAATAGAGGIAGAGGAAARPLASVRILAPVLYPGVIFCAGANYKDHVAEMSTALNLPVERDPHELGLKPWHFIKPAAACVRGTGDAIALPAYSRKVDWEAEIAVVIGRECRHVSVERALDYVAGLSIVNDLSARDHLRRAGVAPDSPFHFDWVSQKSFDGALPFGPWIVPLEFLAGVGELPIKLWVNDELMQDSTSANLIFSMAEQISHLSTRLTLRPGDVIATGTPAGCGSARGHFLKAGDRVRLWVGGIGELVNDFTQPAPTQTEAL